MLGIRKYQDVSIDLFQGDITAFACDILVNAANETLLGGAGVDGAIRRAGGPAIDKACQEIGYCAPGEAVATLAGNLPAQHLIHTVGPRWMDGNSGEAERLAHCYQSSLNLAKDLGGGHISFPAISTGIFGYPLQEAAKVAMQSIKSYLTETPREVHGLHRITLVCFQHDAYQAFQEALFETFADSEQSR